MDLELSFFIFVYRNPYWGNNTNLLRTNTKNHATSDAFNFICYLLLAASMLILKSVIVKLFTLSEPKNCEQRSLRGH